MPQMVYGEQMFYHRWGVWVASQIQEQSLIIGRWPMQLIAWKNARHYQSTRSNYLKHLKLWMVRDWFLLHSNALALVVASGPSIVLPCFLIHHTLPFLQHASNTASSIWSCGWRSATSKMRQSFDWLLKLHFRRLHIQTSRYVLNCTYVGRCMKLVKDSVFISATSCVEPQDVNSMLPQNIGIYTWHGIATRRVTPHSFTGPLDLTYESCFSKFLELLHRRGTMKKSHLPFHQTHLRTKTFL